MPSPVDISVVLHERDVFQSYRRLHRENELLERSSARASARVASFVGAFARSALPAAITVGTLTHAVTSGADRYERYLRSAPVGSERSERVRAVDARRETMSREFARASSPFFRANDLVSRALENFAFHLNEAFDPGAGRARVLESLYRRQDQQQASSLIGGSMIERIVEASGRSVEAGIIRSEVERVARDRDIRNQYQGREISARQRDTLLGLSARAALADRLEAVRAGSVGVGDGASFATVRQALGPADAYANVTGPDGGLDTLAESLRVLGPAVTEAVQALGRVAETMNARAMPITATPSMSDGGFASSGSR